MQNLVTICQILAIFSCFASRSLALNAEEIKALVAEVDQRQRNSGDYQSLVLIDQKEKSKTDKAFEAKVYRRDADDKWMMLFLKPKSESGKGYLRIEKNLFLFDPALGKWDRQTERASIAGTGSQRNDFDESRLADEYQAEFIADEKLGKYKVYHIKLTAKPNLDLSSQLLELWTDVETKNVLKRQEFALSGKLLRTIYYPSWEKMYSKSKGGDVYVPKEIRIFDEVEKGSSTVIALREVKLEPLDANIFTKAWLESQSR
jgi:hypothetical protein